MLVKQISVFLPNKPGQALLPAKALGDAGIDLCAISLADSSDFGILRIITRDYERAIDILKSQGFITNLTDLIGVVAENVSGGLSSLLSVFEKENINIEYFYSYLPRKNSEAIMFFRVESPEGAVEKLLRNGVRLAREF
uniref:Amino acid-binding ACT n=1 Tax=uncultured bacterium contig00029 TaxID=1181518 RepID=A0A806KNH7_9BACT|nr:amino acid-binding ACT [uncultured bacterium contig00029]